MGNEKAGLGARLREEAAKRRPARRKQTAELMGMTVEVRSIMVADKHRLIDEAFVRNGRKLEPKLEKLIPSLFHKSLHDPDTGVPAFASASEVSAFLEDIEDGTPEADEVQAVVDMAMRVSGFTEAAEREAAKNSKAGGD